MWRPRRGMSGSADERLAGQGAAQLSSALGVLGAQAAPDALIRCRRGSRAVQLRPDGLLVEYVPRVQYRQRPDKASCRQRSTERALRSTRDQLIRQGAIDAVGKLPAGGDV